MTKFFKFTDNDPADYNNDGNLWWVLEANVGNVEGAQPVTVLVDATPLDNPAIKLTVNRLLQL